MRRPSPVRLALVVALLAAGPAARAQNLVTNPGFEDGPDFGVPTGYTLTFANGGSEAARVAIPLFAHSGVASFLFADDAPASATLAQTLATVAGAVYRVGFFAYNSSLGDPNDDRLTVAFGGVTVFDRALPSGAREAFTVDLPATSASTELTFTGFNLGAGTYLDDVSVAAVVAPEPATWALVGAGLLSAGLLSAAGAARRRGRGRTGATG